MGLIALFLAVSPLPGPIASIPGFEQEASGNQMCTLVGYRARGFPFKINLYDACGQNPGSYIVAVLINWVVIMAIIYLVYKVSTIGFRRLKS